MLLPKKIEISWHYKNKDWYEFKGYKFTKYKDKFIIPVEHLYFNSYFKVDVLCDYCLEEGKETYCNKTWLFYLKSRKDIEKDCCPQCQAKKIRDVSQKKYGVDNPSQVKEINEKRKETFVERFGYENPSQNEEIQKKKEETCFKNYGVINGFQTEQNRQKIKEICLKKYGVDNPFKNKEFMKEIFKKTYISKYKNKNAPCSKQQLYLCNLLLGELNFPTEKGWLDIAFPEEKIYIEYDGGGHNLAVKLKAMTAEQFKIKEMRRYYFFKNKGWNIIRIISFNNKLPQDNIILKMIKYAK